MPKKNPNVKLRNIETETRNKQQTTHNKQQTTNKNTDRIMNRYIRLYLFEFDK